MHLLTLNAAGKELAPARELPKTRRRLSQVVGRHVDRTRPHMVAIQNARDPLQPIDEAWVVRGKDKAGNIKPWPRRYLSKDDIVVVVYLPRGGIGGSSRGGGRSKSPLSIALSIAAVALIAFSGPIGGAIAGTLGITSAFGISAVTAGVVVGASALMGLASQSKANKSETDTRKVYGVAGGGNLPKQGDRIPRGYGRVWMKPDLSQPDFNQYDGDELILTKRHTLGLGKYRVYQLRAGKQVFWSESQGWIAPFNDPRNKLEFLNGTPSTLAPSNVVAASGVGGELPRASDNPAYAGPYLINQRGALVNRLQVDYQFPQGISRVDFLKQTTRSSQPGEWAVQFEYAPIDESGALIGGWQVLYSGNSGNEGAIFDTHPIRKTKFKDVPPGRYAVRATNAARDTSENTTGSAHINGAQWDGASGWVSDVAVRPGVTEICLRIYATKATGNAAFGEVEADASAIIPVYDQPTKSWIEVETSKAVWAFIDIMRNQDYGGALPDSELDLGTAYFYANSLTQFDTFDGVITGPVSVFEAASTVLLPVRAEPVHLGRFWSFVRDDQKQVRKHKITRRQMARGSTQIDFDLDTSSGSAHVIGEFDQGGDYRNPNQTTAIYGEASLTPLRQKWTGVKAFDHAQHLTRWRAAVGAFRRQTVPFGVELEGRIYKRGDSISVDPWFVEGRQVAGVVSVDGSLLTADCDLSVRPDDVVMFRDRVGRAWGPVNVYSTSDSRVIRLDEVSISQAETNSVVKFEDILDDGVGDMTTFSLGTVSVITENYLIQTVSMTGPKRASVRAVVDDPRVWAAIGAQIVIPPLGENGLAMPESPSIVGLTANPVQIAAGLRCDYSITPGRGAVTFETGISYDDGNTWIIQNNAPITGSIDLNPVDPQVVQVRARAFGATGLPGRYFYTGLTLPAAQLGIALPPVAYADMDKEIQDILDKATDIQDRVDDAVKAAEDALIQARDRVDSIRKALAFDPAIREGNIDPIISDLRQDIDILTKNAARNLNDLALLKDALSTAGLEVIPSEGRVRFYAIERLQSSVGETISNFSVSVDALSKKIELYGSVQTGDLSGLITSITTVQTTLNALQGTISNYVTAAQFNPVEARVSKAETVLDAQAASITSKASQAVVNAQGTRITTAEQRISASEGRIFQAVQATAGSKFDLDILPQTLSSFFDYIQRQQGSLVQEYALAQTNLSANIEAGGKSVASLKTDLLAFQGSTSAQFSELTTSVATANEASVVRQSLIAARFGVNEASIASETSARVTADTAQTLQITSAVSRIGAAEASIVSEATTRANADSAQTTSLNAATSRIGTAEATLRDYNTTFATEKEATATRFSNTSARIGGVEASVNSVSSAYVNADNALSSRIDTVNARVGSAEASIYNESITRILQDNALSSTIDIVSANVGNVDAAVRNEATARVNGDTAIASQISDLYARNAYGTAYGRFYMEAVAAPSGVSARIAAQVSTESYGGRRNAGWSIDLFPDGSSRFVVDANLFALTANGGVSYPFTFDGTTLRVPSLVLTAGNASSPARFDATNYTLAAGAGQLFTRTDPNIKAIVTCDSDSFPTTIAMRGRMGLNPNTLIGSMYLMIDGAQVAPVIVYGDTSGVIGLAASTTSSGGQFFNFEAQTVIFLGPGQHTVEFRYNYTGSNSGSGVVMYEIHIAGVTQKA